jgi:hypothetical protein
MMTKWKVAALIVLAAISVASPALAQSAYTTGTAADSANAGYPSPYRGSYAYAPNSVSRGSGGLGSFAMIPGSHRSSGISRHARGYGSFAMVPGAIGGRYGSAANGGGNPGYNWALENDY